MKRNGATTFLEKNMNMMLIITIFGLVALIFRKQMREGNSSPKPEATIAVEEAAPARPPKAVAEGVAPSSAVAKAPTVPSSAGAKVAAGRGRRGEGWNTMGIH